MLQKYVLEMAIDLLRSILPNLIDRLVDYFADKFSPDRQITEDEKEIADEIIRDESILKRIENLLEQFSGSIEYDQEEFNQKMLGQIKIWLEKLSDFLISSFQEISKETLDTYKEMDKGEIRNRLENIEVNEKINQIVNETRRKREEVEHQSQQPIRVDKSPRETLHPGWLAMDFGTSNSTVTVLDPNEFRDLNQELPKQQRERLSQLFKDWLGSKSPQMPDGVNENNWQEFLKQVNNYLSFTDKGKVEQILASENSSSFLELTRQIEVCLGNQQEQLRKVVSKKLNDIYHEVFQVPPLEDENLILIQLDPNTPDKYEIISELQIENLNPLKVKMGSFVSQKRLDAIGKSGDDNNNDNNNKYEEIKGTFHPSPKRYLIDDKRKHIKVYLENKEEKEKLENKEEKEKEVPVEQLISAAWNHLIKLTETYKNNRRGRFTKGRFGRAVVTYPTVASPVVRRQIEMLVKNLGFIDVNTSYDEAIAAAIFYLWREFGGNKTIGLEAFKTRSRRSGDKWAQNVLVLDIGGGTTDLALIRLILKEEDPFNPGEDRGAGGRYYVLTPELMGSSGHIGLGGELITLRIFRLLKVAIADRILSAFAQGNLKNSELDKIIDSVDQNFRSDDSKFISGSLLKCVDKENAEGDARYNIALDAAEKVLPTRWSKDSKNLQAFYTLWEYAENAKRILGKGIEDFTLKSEKVKELLDYNKEIKNLSDNLDLSVNVSKDQFKNVASQDIEKAIRIAKGLLESRLPVDESKEKEPLDWLILSGQTCKLNLVRDKLKDIFSNSSNIDLDRTRITFVDEYAKLATSVGACYAQRLQQYRYDPVGAKRKLKNGYSEVEIKIKNLLNTLPCTFVRKNQDDSKFDDSIFEPGQSLYQFDKEDTTKARSAWFPLQPTNTINRKDYEGAKEIPWVNFFFEDMAKQISVYSPTFDYIKPFKVQFEVNQKLAIDLLLCNGKPHYLIDSNCPILDAGKILSEKLKTQNKSEQNSQTIISSEPIETDNEPEQNPQTIISSEPNETDNEPEQNPQKMISNDGKLQWNIVIDFLEGSQRTILEAGKKLDRSFRYPDNGKAEPRKGLGLLSESLEHFPVNGKYTVYADYPNKSNEKRQRIFIGELKPPNGKPKENFPYYVTIDEEGVLRIHEGEYFYWTSDNWDDLKKQGCVVRIKPDEISEGKDEERNPFSGIH